MTSKTHSNLISDLLAAIVVFFIAVPLCLGIALASGAPIISGVISGIVGACLVPLFSRSKLSINGPSAGLTIIVLNAITLLNGIEVFLLSIVVAGLIQILMALLRLGNIASYFPSAVIKAMLSGVGIILLFQQIPHLIGYIKSPLADETSFLSNPLLTVENIFLSLKDLSLPVILVSLISLSALILWNNPRLKNISFLAAIPAPLICVALGILYTFISGHYFPEMALSSKHLVSMPSFNSWDQLIFPKWSELSNPLVYQVAFTLALIASIESILSIDAIEKLDPRPSLISPNRELLSQGIGNIVSGLLGGLPVSAAIIRSSANVHAGAKTRNSSIFHGLLLFFSLIFMAPLLNLIPLASLASILFLTGYKLAKLTVFKEMYKNGYSQFIPFMITVAMIVFTDLLTGMMIGLVCGLCYIIYSTYGSNISVTSQGKNYLIKMQKDVSFLNKRIVQKHLESIPEKSSVIIDGQKADFIDHDIREMIKEFSQSAAEKDINVLVKMGYQAKTPFPETVLRS